MTLMLFSGVTEMKMGFLLSLVTLQVSSSHVVSEIFPCHSPLSLVFIRDEFIILYIKC